MSLCYITLKICLHPRIPSCIRLACWNKTVLLLSLRNTSSSKKRARKERTGQLSIIGMMRPCMFESKKGKVTVVFNTVFKDDRWCGHWKGVHAGQRQPHSPAGPLQPHGGTSPRAERSWSRRGPQHQLYHLRAVTLPIQCQCSRQHHQPDPYVPRLPALPHQVLEALYSHTLFCVWNIRLPQGAELCMPRCQEKGNENNHGEDVTFGNRKRKQMATKGWNTCYGIIVAFNVVPLQVLKGFSVLVPFCTCLESNLQKQAVLARTSWFPRIKKQKNYSTWSI